MKDTNEFYVGYQPDAPEGLARFRRCAALAIVGIALAVALGLGAAQDDFEPSIFEFGQQRTWTGNLYTRPYPLLVKNGRSYVIVGPGKHAFSIGTAANGAAARLEGSLAANGSNRLVEVAPESLTLLTTGTNDVASTSGRQVTLSGEIVDTKCHFGVMNPGFGKVHRDCAVRCLSGGIPPGFLVRDSQGRRHALLLADAEGERVELRTIRDFVAEPVRLTGRLRRLGDATLFLADLRTIERLP